MIKFIAIIYNKNLVKDTNEEIIYDSGFDLVKGDDCDFITSDDIHRAKYHSDMQDTEYTFDELVKIEIDEKDESILKTMYYSTDKVLKTFSINKSIILDRFGDSQNIDLIRKYIYTRLDEISIRYYTLLKLVEEFEKDNKSYAVALLTEIKKIEKNYNLPYSRQYMHSIEAVFYNKDIGNQYNAIKEKFLFNVYMHDRSRKGSVA